MSGRTWSGDRAVKLVAAFGALLLILLFVGSLARSCNGPNDTGGECTNYGEEYKHGGGYGPGWWGVAERLVSSEDTLAQWLMTVFSFLAVFVSAAAVYFVKKTLAATQEMVLDARRIGEAQSRAYPSAVSVAIIGVTNSLPALEARIKNSGNSPALRMKCRGDIKLTYQEPDLDTGITFQRSLKHDIVSGFQVPIPPHAEGVISIYAPHGLGDKAAEVMKAMSSGDVRKNPFWSVTIYFEWVDVFEITYDFYIIASQFPMIPNTFGIASAYRDIVLSSPFMIDYQSESRQSEKKA